MLFNFLFVLTVSYLFSSIGTRQLIQARITDNNKAEHIAYVMFLIVGTVIGNYLTILIASHYAPDQLLLQIFAGTISSIITGESLYHYHKKMARRIPTIKERKNY